MYPERALLIGALRQAVAGAPADLPREVNWQAFYHLCQAHKVTGLVYQGLSECPDYWQTVPEAAQNILKSAYMQAIFADSQQEYIHSKLHNALQEAGVRHVFLKGADLKYGYPIPALRTMSDMDILVETRDYPKIDAVCEKLGGKPYDGDGNHRNFYFPGKVCVEFHPNLVHPGIPFGTEMNPGWQFVTPEGDMTPEGKYLHAMSHLAGHFATGGVGVRFVLDIWVLRNRAKNAIDESYVNQKLKEYRLLAFAENIEALAQIWFGQGKTDPALEELADYIFTSGSHGNTHREQLNAVSLSSGGNRVSTLLSKAFYPRQELESRYPWCQGKPWLLPAAWCNRAWEVATKRSHLVKQWAVSTGQFTKEEIKNQQEMLARFGLKR